MVTGLACPSVVLPRIPLLTRLAGFNFRNGGCRSPRKLWTGFSSGGKSEKIGVPKCLIHGVGGGGGGGGGFWEGADSSDNNHFALSKGSFRKEDSVLLSLIQEIEPLDVSLIQKDVSADTLDAMKRTISGMLGLLPSDQFHVLIEAFWEPLSRLLVSSMMTGYTLQNAEYRLCLQKSLYMSEDYSLARQKEETSEINNPEALDDGDRNESDLAQGKQKTSKMEVVSEEEAGLQDLDIPEGLGELSPEAQDYIRDLQSQLTRFSNELQESQLKNAALQMQNLAGEEKNDLLDYLRSLEPEKVAELSEPTSSEVQNYDASSHASSQVSSCESPEGVKLLKSEIQSLRETNANLRKQVRELRSKVHLSEQGQHSAQKQTSALEIQVKAGPIGTVKSVRTNPTVLPDESINPDLAELLQKVAIDNELIVGLANYNVKEMLEIWSDSIKRVGVTNYLVVALDDSTAEHCKSRGVPVYRRDPADAISKTVGKTGDNHAVSGLKFHLLREFLQLGYSVLLSDVDIVYLQNPFNFLYRDCDVESMTDGHSNMTAYGFDDVFDDPPMGWSRYAHTMRIWVFNSGFFYIRPTIPSIELLDRVVDRLSKEIAWDQAVFNELLFFPSHPGYEGLHASKRAMDYYLFLNSKVLFTKFRKEPEMPRYKPVIVHINYHPDKLNRMKAVVEYYVHGKKEALKPFPDGSDW